MDDIDLLEHGGGGAMVRHRGALISLADPRAMHFQKVLEALDAQHAPGTPVDIPEWKRQAVFERWAAAWDLPVASEAIRLAYLVDHYRAAASYDLRVVAGVDLGELWRARRWRHLLDLLDNLPAHMPFSAATVNDPEHAAMVAKAIVDREEAAKDSAEKSAPNAPPLVGFSPEVAALTRLIDAVNGVAHMTILANSDRPVPEPKPEPRPESAIDVAVKLERYRRRKEKHEALAARVLKRKR